ncbi:MAG TPA: citrate lyase acyl carrier protein [Clostridiales bacterium]|jgi:citrate lyase subunit gamma (acyl carrier protein)|nr:citrate lyase acyl carrier protein [Clostridiales bacterium]
MKIQGTAIAGTLESNDVLITLSPSSNNKVEIDLSSIVKKQFGDQIEEIVREMLEEFNIEEGNIKIQDMGALDCTIKARIETAILRLKEGK